MPDLHITDVAGTVTLNNNYQMPYLGLGVWKMKNGGQVEGAIEAALQIGYRLIDTAAFYQNEEGVGAAIRNSGLKREEVFVTSKVWNADQGYEETLAAFDKSNSKLGLGYIDLYLIHWPVEGKYKHTWRALENLYRDGKVKAIGVSNFMSNQLSELLTVAEIVPAVNQIEFHPYLIQPGLLKLCRSNNIWPQAWSPLMQGNMNQAYELTLLSNRYDKSPAQILLRWDLQRGVLTIPKSSNAGRIRENAEIFDFELEEDDMALINTLDRSYRYGPDPHSFEF